jgi:threonylcarbamoyladenosine tRNA methylthiotransferase MtaB
MNVYLKSLGCRLNEAELEQWAAEFHSRGRVIVRSAGNADIIILNTCAVTREAVKKSRQLIRKSRRHNPLAKLVVSGCCVSLTWEMRDPLADIDLLIPNCDKDRLPAIIEERLAPAEMPRRYMNAGDNPLFHRGRNRAFIKIQDGCRHRCTYCVVTIARGVERSRPVADVVNQINRLSSQGVKEAVLTGVHVGGYGSDIKSDLHTLIQFILSETDIPRLRLASVEPWDLHDKFFELFQNQRLMPHLHLPLQSGSDVVLKAMARRCNTANYAALVNKARSAAADFNVTTDVIVGFPGETEHEWRKSMEFYEAIGFSHIHIFPFSARAGTKAASLSNQIPSAEKKLRCQQLADLAQKMKRAFLKCQILKSTPVLIERYNDRLGQYLGYTPNYCRVILNTPYADGLCNTISQVRLLSLNKSEDCVCGMFNDA